MSDICAHMALFAYKIFIDVSDINKTRYALGIGDSCSEYFCLLGCDIV